jgi:hypothetical protein
MTDGTDPSAPDIERDIQRTRGELARTVDALEHRLSLRHLVEEGMEMFNNRIVGSENLNRGFDAIRANPVPVALIGIGAAWLVANNTGMAERIARDERVESARRRVVGFADTVGTRAGEMASSVTDAVGLGNSGSDRALGHTGNPIVDHAEQEDQGWMHQVTGMARDTLGGPVNYATDRATRIADRVGQALEDHPLAVGAIGVMAGMLIAALLPMTRTETDLLGDSSTQLWKKAREAGEDVVSRVRDTASEAATQAATQVATQIAEQAVNAVTGQPPEAERETDTKQR